MRNFNLLNEEFEVIGNIDAKDERNAVVAWNRAHESREAAVAVDTDPAGMWDDCGEFVRIVD